MKMDKHSVLVIHGGGVYGDKEKTLLKPIFDEAYPNGIPTYNLKKNTEKI